MDIIVRTPRDSKSSRRFRRRESSTRSQCEHAETKTRPFRKQMAKSNSAVSPTQNTSRTRLDPHPKKEHTRANASNSQVAVNRSGTPRGTKIRKAPESPKQRIEYGATLTIVASRRNGKGKPQTRDSRRDQTCVQVATMPL